MNVYITYDRYEHDEWHSVYRIETNKQRAIKFCKEEDLIDFISYGPDDCHSFQLQKVVMTKEEYLRLVYLVEHEGGENPNKDEEKELHDFLANLYDKTGCVGYEDVLISTDGCSDNWELIQYYCNVNKINFEDIDEREKVEELIFNDEELYMKYLKEYIKLTY